MAYTVVGSVKTRAARVVWMLEELGLPYDHLPLRPGSQEARQVNPSGKVPALVVDGVTLTDSVAILTYLADRHGQFTHPAGTIARAQQDGFTGLILDELEAPLWTAARHSFVLPEEMRLAEIKPSLRWEFQRNQARLAEGFAGPFLMGEVMTVPDLLLSHCLSWAAGAKFPDPAPVLAAFQARMTARPAWARAMAR
jgi:glutathione S-transferase